MFRFRFRGDNLELSDRNVRVDAGQLVEGQRGTRVHVMPVGVEDARIEHSVF